MKQLLLLTTLITSFSASAVTISPSLMWLAASGNSDKTEDLITGYGGFSTSMGLTSSTSATTVLGGLLVFADGENTVLDLENDSLLDELEMIQMNLEDGEELSPLQNAILRIGVENDQLDIYGNVVE